MAEIAVRRRSWYHMSVEATRKRLEALLAQLRQATANADHTIAEVKAALREIDDARAASAPRTGPAVAGRRKMSAPRSSRKR